MSYWINRGQISMESEYRRRRRSPHRRGPQEWENRRGQKAALIAFNIALLIMLFPVAIMGSQELSAGRARMSLSACFDNGIVEEKYVQNTEYGTYSLTAAPPAVGAENPQADSQANPQTDPQAGGDSQSMEPVDEYEMNREAQGMEPTSGKSMAMVHAPINMWPNCTAIFIFACIIILIATVRIVTLEHNDKKKRKKSYTKQI